MPRGPRIIIDSAYYHIMNRGNQKQRIFLEDTDFVEYLKILKFFKKKYGFRILGYCLMPNHVHLIIDIKQPNNLARFMQGITQVYTMWYNKKYNKTGHLWQGRFKSMVIQKDNYFLDCVYYVEVNPVRAKLVSTPADYRWSSYRERVLGIKSIILDLPNST
ncbi:MAG: transposase [Candidatus Omnitrophota bacterium]|nr:transposase [Candidatus Omnitrophota bacterium]MBU1929574.1 transposase [Candidatus Omnitrophota bacterium]MBU2034161.1 transposase [Candidatus Omnitrophota bacterium]MBU2221191.1 transposase [Candidatus Omnitrophota bacterium]MBU2258799.1 transposase [Candidatus Omnitrophota bacterium]